MGLLNPAYAPLVPFERPTEDADGNTAWAQLGDTPAVVQLVGPGLESSSGTTYAQSGIVFVPRGSDLKVGDRFTWGGVHYMLSGGPNGDQDHPFTGDDFGWVSFTFIGQIARWGMGSIGR